MSLKFHLWKTVIKDFLSANRWRNTLPNGGDSTIKIQLSSVEEAPMLSALICGHITLNSPQCRLWTQENLLKLELTESERVAHDNQSGSLFSLFSLAVEIKGRSGFPWTTLVYFGIVTCIYI